MIVYFDASALVKRYVDEPGADRVRALFSREPVVATAIITRAEVAAALAKARRMRRLNSQGADSALQSFEKDWEDIARIQLTESIVEQAVQLAWKHGLRGYDSVQLASALFWRSQLDNASLLATFDRELWEAAKSENLTPWPESIP